MVIEKGQAKARITVDRSAGILEVAVRGSHDLREVISLVQSIVVFIVNICLFMCYVLMHVMFF